MPTNSTTARLRAVAGALALTAVLAACGTDTASTGTAGAAPSSASAAASVSTDNNDADIRFAQGMIPHHKQAVEMAELAADRAANQDVRDLAEQIRSAQDPEIVTMTGFLTTWGAEVPDASMGGMDHSGGMDAGGMTGMMTSDQMSELGASTGATFDTMFLQMMIAHHEGAITDSQRELSEGANPQAKELATRIVEAQTAEIARMQQLLQAS